MIIIAENKKSHYLIKKFLIETGIENDSSKRHFNLKPISNNISGDNPDQYVQLDLKPVGSRNVYTDTEEILPSDIKFKKLIKKDQKYRKLANLAIKGILTFGMIAKLFDAIPDQKNLEQTNQQQITAEDDIKKEMIARSPNNAEEISLTFNDIQEENTSNVIIDYNKVSSFEEIIDIIIGHEDFRSTPYPDHKQWSIGYGSRVSDQNGSFINKSKHNKLRPKYNNLYRRYQRSGKNADLKRLLRWTDSNYSGNWYKDLHGIQGNSNKFTVRPLTRLQAREMLVKSLKNELQRLKSNADFKFDKMPKNIQAALSDMSYNMGGAFINKFKNLHECLKLIDKIQNKGSISKLDQDVLEDLFISASQEIESSLYAEELPNRAKSNIELVRNAIENFTISDKTFQNETFKKVYIHLFT